MLIFEISSATAGILNSAGFRDGVDRYGAAVGSVARIKARDLQMLCELARASTTLSEFEARFVPGGNASASVGHIKDDISSLLEKASGSTPSGPKLKEFLAHLVLIEFDFLHEGQSSLPSALNTLRDCLVAGEAQHASALWDRLCTLTNVVY